MASDTLPIRTPKGSTVHLVALGEQSTLCGRRHGFNTCYVTAGATIRVEAHEVADCRKCLAIAGRA